MKNSIIRFAKDSDLKAVQELNHQLFVHDGVYDETLVMSWPFEKFGEDYFKERISGLDGVCFVAEVQGEMVGYLAGGIIKESYSGRTIKKISELENMIVGESSRGKGIGEKLIREFIKWSKERGAERIKVSAYSGNHDAIRFYEKVGFVPNITDLEYEVV